MKISKNIKRLLLVGTILMSLMVLVQVGLASAWIESSGPGLHITPLIAGQDMENPAGTVRVWN